MSRYRKAIAALLGTITPAVFIFVLGLVHVHIDPTVAAAICAVLGTVATILAPANASKPVSGARLTD